MSDDTDLGYTVSREGQKLFVCIAGETRHISEWAREWGVTSTCVSQRLREQFPLNKLRAGRTENRLAGLRSARSLKKQKLPPEPAATAAQVALARDVCRRWLYRPAITLPYARPRASSIYLPQGQLL